LVGKVIIIKFSQFYRTELSNLLFLEHLARKYEEEGVSLIFINSLGKHYGKAIKQICSFSSPIVIDDGLISGMFNASPESTVIVDRDFKIKFMSGMNYFFNKSLVNNEVIKWAFEGDQSPSSASNEELASIINKLTFYDVKNEKEIQINNFASGKKIIFTLFTATCTGCEDNRRIQLLKAASLKINPKKTQIIFLFGIGNNAEAISRVTFVNGWNELPITIGVMNNLNAIGANSYYKLFQLDTDPRTFIIKKNGEIDFAENFKNSRSIDLDTLLNKR